MSIEVEEAGVIPVISVLEEISKMSGGRCSLNADARQIRGADASVRTEKLPEGPEWSVELKLDGDRALAIKNYMNIWRVVPAAILLCPANAVLADTITILNPSFEANVLSCTAGLGCATVNTLAGWTGFTTDPAGFVSDIPDHAWRTHLCVPRRHSWRRTAVNKDSAMAAI